MKQLLLLSAVFFLAACACTKKAPTTLPPETQEGKNTFGCLIDGKIFYPYKSPWAAGSGALRAVYNTREQNISIRAFNQDLNQTISFFVNIDIENIIVKKPYRMTQDSYYYYKDPTQTAYLLKSENGFVTFTRFDQKEKISSGTFSLKVNNHDGRTINVTDGRFDVKFQIEDTPVSLNQ